MQDTVAIIMGHNTDIHMYYLGAGKMYLYYPWTDKTQFYHYGASKMQFLKNYKAGNTQLC